MASADRRNLLTEIRSIKTEDGLFGPEDVTYWTLYRYDETGNRIFKLQYRYIVSTPPEGYEDSQPGDSLVVEQGDGNGYWVFQSKSFYVRDISGKEIAIYSGTSIEQWNIYGLDNVGKINSDNKRYFYLKDHLGSIRATLDTTNAVVGAQDYDPWGYPLENRTWQVNNTKYKFTGKERDSENNYDYYGARYYDSRIGRWGGVEPLLEKYLSISPFIYATDNPILFVDVDGKGLGDGFYCAWAISPVDQIKNAVNEINKNTEELINNLQSGNYFDAYLNYAQVPTLALTLIPSSPIIDFMMPLGMVNQSPKLLNLSKGFTFSDHAIDKLKLRNITKSMVTMTLEEGVIYTGHKSGALSVVSKESFSSGLSLLVGINPKTKIVTTVIKSRYNKLIKKLNLFTSETFKTMK